MNTSSAWRFAPCMLLAGALGACTSGDSVLRDLPASLPAPTRAAPDSAIAAPASSSDFLSQTAADERARTLLSAMTLDEKIQLVHGAGLGSSPIGGGGFIKGIPRLGIPDINAADSLPGVTPLPAPVALAATWDAGLAREVGTLVGQEMRSLGFAESLALGLNLAREPRNGRTFEYMGEDPVLAGTLAAERIQATQSQRVVATLKHFALNGQETNRFFSNSVIDERAMRETELLAFEIGVIKGRPGNIMCGYNLVNGVKSCESKALITDILKGEWGYTGKVQSDWVAAISDTTRAANAGTDEEQPGSQDDSTPNAGGGFQPTFFNQKLRAAVQSGQVPLSRLDDMVFRKLRTLYRIGVMDLPPKPAGQPDVAVGDALAQRVAERAMVLLKNVPAGKEAASVLPLSATVKSIVVIGGHADRGVMGGAGAGGTPSRAPSGIDCNTPGATFMGLFPLCATWHNSSPLMAIRAAAPNATVTFVDGKDAAAAASVAAAADVAIVFATQFSGEAVDAASLSLASKTTDPANQDYDQNALIAAVSAKAKRSVVVIEAGSAVTMPWVDSVHAIVHAWYPGSRGGPAIANVLFGVVNPSGKLPISFPVQDADLPQPRISADNPQVLYAEGSRMGYRWYDSKGITPLFPFGHGLSYTTFNYSGLAAIRAASGDVSVRFTLTNTGSRAGEEVAQIYASLPAQAGDVPRRLVAFAKVKLAPGQRQEVSLTIPAARFAIWAGGWKVPAGIGEISVRTSSREAKLSTKVPLEGMIVPHGI